MSEHPFLIFLLGFLAGFVPVAGAVVWYYLRAKKRVASIQAAIRRYQEATRSVGNAANVVYGKKPQ